MDRYKYSVTPFSPIRDLIPGKSIRAPFTADLDKDEVFLCMKHGPVYRLFPGKNPIKVTGSNFESLHKSKYEYEEVVEEVKAEQPVYVEPEPEVVEEVPVEEKLETVDESNPFEEVSVETPVQEEPVEEEYVEPEVEEDTYEEEVSVEESYEQEEEYTEEVEEEEPVEETPVAESQNTQQPHTPQFKPNYSKKKKNKNRH